MKYASVTDVVRRIKEDIHGDYRLQSLAMEGNIIGLKRASNGHYYMNIRDDQCSIRAIVFRSRVTAAVRAVREGDHVVVIGAVNVYEKGGALSFIIEQLFSQCIPLCQSHVMLHAVVQKQFIDTLINFLIPDLPVLLETF